MKHYEFYEAYGRTRLQEQVKELQQANDRLYSRLDTVRWEYNKLLEEIEPLKKKNRELQENVDALLEINRFYSYKLQRYRLIEDMAEVDKLVAHISLECIADILLRFPFESTANIAKEYGLTKSNIIKMAAKQAVFKSEEEKTEAEKYLSHLNLKLPEARGRHNAKKVVMVSSKGDTLDFFNSITEAAIETGFSEDQIRKRCACQSAGRLSNNIYKDVTFRYKKEPKKDI